MSSHTDITRSMWCSTSITDIRSVRPRSRRPSSASSSSDRPLAGSSSITSSGSLTSARASATFLRTA